MSDKTRYGDFIFNKHGVCVNYERIEIDNNTRVEIAQCGDNAWVYGFSYSWGGSPCMRDVDVCKTREQAIKRGLSHLLLCLEQHSDSKAAAKIVRQKLFDTRQLTLFG